MKVISFLEWFKSNFKDNGIPEIHLYGNYVDIVSFYSQPFKPEMITEYFEGWGQQQRGRNPDTYGKFYSIVKSEVTLITFHFNSQFPKCCSVGWFYSITDNIGEISYINLPIKTLDDFINVASKICERANTELTFKPETIEKYF